MIPNQKSDARPAALQLPQHLAGSVRDPGVVRMGHATGEMDATRPTRMSSISVETTCHTQNLTVSFPFPAVNQTLHLTSQIRLFLASVLGRMDILRVRACLPVQHDWGAGQTRGAGPLLLIP